MELLPPFDGQLVLYGKFTPQRVHPRDFVLVTHSYASERFWVQVVKHKDGIIWGIVDLSLEAGVCGLAAGQEDSLLNVSRL
jgi:hypothetical protein